MAGSSVVAPDLRAGMGSRVLRAVSHSRFPRRRDAFKTTRAAGCDLRSLLGRCWAALVAANCPELVVAVIAEDLPPVIRSDCTKTPYGPLFPGHAETGRQHPRRGAIARQLGDVVLGNDGEGRPLRLRDIRDGAAIDSAARWLCDLIPVYIRFSNAIGATVSTFRSLVAHHLPRRCLPGGR